MSGNLPALPADSAWRPIARVPGGRLLCRCTCGRELVRVTAHFTRARKPSRSCGCERRLRQVAAAIVHGHAARREHTPEYASWHGMVQRTSNEAHKNFDRYGGRGIKVCERWQTFETFLADMGSRPSARHSIDRKDNARGYSCGKCDDCIARGEPANCRWATRREQVNNRSVTVRLTIGNETLPIADWARDLGVDYAAFQMRIANAWTAEDAIGVAFRGETQWAHRDRLLRSMSRLPSLRGVLLRALYAGADGGGLLASVRFLARASPRAA